MARHEDAATVALVGIMLTRIVAAVGQFFRTQLHDVAQAGYGTRYTPFTQIVVPASISQFDAGVSLDNVVKYHTMR